MALTIQTTAEGDIQILQQFARPAVYLDHWALRLFSNNIPLQVRFLEALHSSESTWLFSTTNLMEFCAMEDGASAEASEKLLSLAFPHIHLADTMVDKGYFFEEGAPPHPDAPKDNWLIQDLSDRAKLAGGIWNTHRFLRDAIDHRATLLPEFNDLKQTVANVVIATTKDKATNERAKKFRPTKGMTLRDAFKQELLRHAHVDGAHVFTENDTIDYLHAVPAAVACDLILLDSSWCHKVNQAAKRLKAGGVHGKIARCFSPKSIPDFLSALEGLQSA